MIKKPNRVFILILAVATLLTAFFWVLSLFYDPSLPVGRNHPSLYYDYIYLLYPFFWFIGTWGMVAAVMMIFFYSVNFLQKFSFLQKSFLVVLLLLTFSGFFSSALLEVVFSGFSWASLLSFSSGFLKTFSLVVVVASIMPILRRENAFAITFSPYRVLARKDLFVRYFVFSFIVAFSWKFFCQGVVFVFQYLNRWLFYHGFVSPSFGGHFHSSGGVTVLFMFLSFIERTAACFFLCCFIKDKLSKLSVFSGGTFVFLILFLLGGQVRSFYTAIIYFLSGQYLRNILMLNRDFFFLPVLAFGVVFFIRLFDVFV